MTPPADPTARTSDTRTPEARRRARARRRRAIRRRRVVALLILVVAVGIPVLRSLPSGVTVAESGEAAGAAAAPAPLARDIRLTAVGDIVMGSPPYGLPSDGGRSLFSAVRPLLGGDVVLGNFEGTFAPAGVSKCGPTPGPNCFAFRTPPSYVRWPREAGFTVMSVANNHADDYGSSGRARTRTVLASAGIRPTGWPGSIAYMRTGAGTVAVVAFAPNNVSNSMLDIAAAAALVRRAAAKAPVVVVTMHAGAEGSKADRVRPGTETFLGENRGDSLRFAHAVVDAGADLVVGHGPHVMRGLEFYRGRLIAYSMGNFMGYAVFSLSGNKSRSAVLDVTLGPDGGFRSGRLQPVTLIGKGVPRPGGTILPHVRRISQLDFGARAAIITAAGIVRPPRA